MKYANPLALSIFAAIPYVLVTWGYTKLTNGDAKAFWVALGILLGIRFFFFTIERLGDALSWRLYRRKIAVDNAFAFLMANAFPPREYDHDNFGNYLARIQDGPEYAQPLRHTAVEIERVLTFVEQLGILVGERAWAAYEAALDIYAPRSKATRRL